MIKLNDLQRQNLFLMGEFIEVFGEIVKDSAFILRKDVADFELRLQEFLDTKNNVIGVNSATDALFLAMNFANIRSGDQVLVPSRTYIASISAIIHVGAIPVFVDVDDNFNLCMDDAEAKVSSATRAIMPIHLSGQPCDMQRLHLLAKKNNLVIIEDAAPAVGAKFKGKAVGTLGEFGAISLHPLKALSALGDGGLLLVQDNSLAERARVFRDHGHMQPKILEEYTEFGINSRLDNLQAAFCKIKLKYLNQWIERRREIAKYYSEQLISTSVQPQGAKYLKRLEKTSDYFDTFNSFVLELENPKQFQEFMMSGANPIEVATCFSRPLHNHPNLVKQFKFEKSISLPKTEYYSKRTVVVPIYPELTDNEVETISKKLYEYFS
jgi:dTDP-4-amino-4,6-dideoxygalactose transaminase